MSALVQPSPAQAPANRTPNYALPGRPRRAAPSRARTAALRAAVIGLPITLRGQLGEMTEIVTDSWQLSAAKRLLAANDAEHPPEL